MFLKKKEIKILKGNVEEVNDILKKYKNNIYSLITI